MICHYRHGMERARITALADGVVVLLLASSALVEVWSSTAAMSEARGVHTVLTLGFTLPLLFRRRHSVVVLLMVAASSWLQLELGGGLGQPFFAVLIALYAVGAHAGFPQTLAGPAAVALQIAALDIPRLIDGNPADEVLPAWFVLTGTWFFGRWMRHRRRESVLLAERADVAVRDAADRAEQAVSAERARIARELHDLVAHSMGVIVIQSQGAQRSLDNDLEASRSALAAIENTGRDGLAEMRRLLDLLTTAERTPMTPQPGIDELDDLVANVRSAGMPVTLDVEGQPRGLAPGVELAAYRVVQESLTNVLKHAGGAAARVVLRYRPDSIEVEVSNDGLGASTNGSEGHGLVGMQERSPSTAVRWRPVPAARVASGSQHASPTAGTHDSPAGGRRRGARVHRAQHDPRRRARHQRRRLSSPRR